jgi:trehalose 6-phosphate synthase
VIVLANRAPLRHERGQDGRVTVKRSASGLVSALEPLVEAYSGIWVAHGSGNADTLVVDERGGLNVPPARPRYRLRYVSLSDDEQRGYYYGFANEGLWPLCHTANVKPVFRADDFRCYQTVNSRFAAVVAEEAAIGSPIVLVQDYHFALAPRVLRQRLPSSIVVVFWHVPWPRPHVFRTCPWARELLEGLLGSSIVGLQTDEDCSNFLGSVESIVGADVDLVQKTVIYRGRSTSVGAYPVGIEWANRVLSTTPPSAECRERVCRDLQLAPHVRLGVGIDRLDYTKGINQKFLAIERLLELRPDLRGCFVFVQVAEPSRDCLPAYQAARAQLLDTSERVNRRFGTSSYRPIRLLEAHHEPAEVYRFYRAADLCYVASLHDGMNLVAKEFVCARDDERGALVLSKFAGAAQQLRAALIVNPYEVDGSADVLSRGLGMSVTEQAKRMRLLRANVETFGAAWWVRQLIHDAMLVRHAGFNAARRRGAATERMTA